MVLSPPPVDGTPAGAEGEHREVDASAAADGEVVQQVNAPARDLDALPPGYRFTPQDEELIVFYLRNKILGLPLPLNKIHDVRLYDHNPADLAARHEPWEVGKWFFFTPRDRKYPNGSRPSRSAGDGYWKATGADKTIRRNGVLVGWRKALVFYIGRPPKGEKTNWIMHEYRAKEEGPPRQFDGTMKLDDCILCTVHEKTGAVGRRAARKADQGSKGELSGRNKAKSPPPPPPLPPPPPPPLQPSENSMDAPVLMQQGGSSCDNDHYYQLQQYFHGLTSVYPPQYPIVQERFPEQYMFPHETIQGWNAGAHVLGNQVPSAAAAAAQYSSAGANYCPAPANDQLGYRPVQGNPPAPPPALDANYGTLPTADVTEDISRMFSMDLKIDPTDYLLPNPRDGYEPDHLTYDQQFICYDAIFPPTNALEHYTSNFSSSWSKNMAAESFDTALPFETGATLQIHGTAPSATCDAPGIAASGENFTSNNPVPAASYYLTSEPKPAHRDDLEESTHQADPSPGSSVGAGRAAQPPPRLGLVRSGRRMGSRGLR